MVPLTRPKHEFVKLSSENAKYVSRSRRYIASGWEFETHRLETSGWLIAVHVP